jgi:hypothetical protein
MRWRIWTHTLLLDFADLARLIDPTSVLSLFRRPMLGRITGYEKSLSVGAGRNAVGLGGAELEFARPVVAGLYGRPNDKMIIERPIGLNVEAVVLALWAQQRSHVFHHDETFSIKGLRRAGSTAARVHQMATKIEGRT